MIYYALSALVVAGIAWVFYWIGKRDASIDFGKCMAMGLDKCDREQFIALMHKAQERLWKLSKESEGQAE